MRKSETATDSIRGRLHWRSWMIVLPLALYVVLATQSLTLPGPYYDEVLQVVPAIAAVEGSVNGTPVQVSGSVIHFGDRSFPLLILPYLGASQAAIFTLVFSFLPPSVTVIRLTTIALGAVALAFTFLAVRRFFDHRTAIIATLLVATDASFIFSMRSDNGPAAVMMICKLGALWLLVRWWQTGERWPLLAGAFLCGYGVYDKTNFLWFLGALALAVSIVYPRELLNYLRRRDVTSWVGAAIFFAFGSSIMLAYTVMTMGGPFRSVSQLAGSETALGTDNTNILSNLETRLQTSYELLSGYAVLDFYTSTFSGLQHAYDRGPFLSSLLPALAVVAVVGFLGHGLSRNGDRDEFRKQALLLLLTLFIVVASVITPTNLMYHHLLLFYPFVHVFVARGIALLMARAASALPWQRLSSLGVRTAVGLVLLDALLVSNLGVVSVYYRTLSSTGGIGMWSDSVYALTDYLYNHDEDDSQRRVVCMDWGICLNLLALSNGRIHTDEVWSDYIHGQDQSRVQAMMELVTTPNQVFVFHAEPYSGVAAIWGEDTPRRLFFDAVAATGSVATLETSIAQRTGDLLFEVYSVTPATALDGSEAEQQPPSR